MTVHISIPLDEEQVARLDAIAAAKSASTADVVAEAVASFLEHEAWFVAGVEEGLAQKAAGDVFDMGEVVDDLRARMGRNRQAG